MNSSMKLGLGVAGGYLLGRTRKLKLAIGLGAWLAGKRLNLSAGQLLMQAAGTLRETPEVAELGNRVRTELVGAGKRAVASTATSQLDAITDRLKQRNDELSGAKDAKKPERQRDDYEEPEDELEDDEPRDDYDEAEDDEPEDELDDDEPRDDYDEAEDDEPEDELDDDEPRDDYDEAAEAEEPADEPYPEERRRSSSRRSSGGSRGSSTRRGSRPAQAARRS